MAESSSLYFALAYVTLGGFILIAGQFSFHQYKLRKSEWNKAALEILNNQQHLCQMLGPPISPGYVFTKTRKNTETDSLQVQMPVNGNKSRGNLVYEINKTAEGKWQFTKMHFHFTDEAGGIVRLLKERETQNE